MKTKASPKYLVVFLLVSTFFNSCIQRNYYDSPPSNYNNNNNNNNTGNTTGYRYLFDEEFNGSDLYGWNFTDAADSAYASIQSGSYQYVDYSTKLFSTSVVSTGANTTGNFVVQANIKSNNTMGLLFGASSTTNGYAFYVDSNGYYSLYSEGNSTTASTLIIPSTQDTLYATKKGWNLLELDQINGNWTGFINGTQIFQIAARSVTGSGFGFKVAPGTIGYADYIIVKSN